jgi:hypothetical protein
MEGAIKLARQVRIMFGISMAFDNSLASSVLV